MNLCGLGRRAGSNCGDLATGGQGCKQGTLPWSERHSPALIWVRPGAGGGGTPHFYNYSTCKLESFVGPLDTEVELKKHDHLHFLGSPESFPTLNGIETDSLETIDSAAGYSLQKWTRK